MAQWRHVTTKVWVNLVWRHQAITWTNVDLSVLSARSRISYIFNTLRPIRNGRHFPEDIFKCIFLVKIMAWRRPGDSHYLNNWWLVYRRIYVSFGPDELMSMFAITLISPTSLSNGKFFGRAIPIIVPFTMFENLFQDWDAVLKKVLCFSRKSTIWWNLSGTKKTVTVLHHVIIFFVTKWPGWWLGADEHLNEDGEIKCTSLHFENTMFETWT